MEQNIAGNVARPQQVAFYLALADLLGLTALLGARAYVASFRDPQAERRFVLAPAVIEMIPVFALAWVVACVLVGNSVLASRRVTRYGLGAIVMLAALATPVAFTVIVSFWSLLNAP